MDKKEKGRVEVLKLPKEKKIIIEATCLSRFVSYFKTNETGVEVKLKLD